ncbi:MAG: glucose-6-phosphate isomerase [Sulfuricurvum sp.]|nr:glucose-6-phosphate isomerase [Sulfuricurvum sp.]
MIFKHNFDENQTPIQEAAFASVREECDSQTVGYYALPSDTDGLIERLEDFKQKNSIFASGKIRDIAIVGIGGSSLGTKGIDSLLKSKATNLRTLHFFENTDPIIISETLSKLTKENTLFIIISKSGTTIETISIFKTIISHFGLEIEGSDKERILIITDQGSALSKFGNHYDLAQFSIPQNVGGRFSVLSAVGIVPLTLAGYDTKALLEGAESFLQRFFERKEDHLLTKASYLYLNSHEKTINVIFAYANELENLCKWYVQLWGESLGKIDSSGKSVGLTPASLIGSVDQHSFLQLLIEGPKDKTVTFLTIEDFEMPLVIPNISLKYLEMTDFVNTKNFNTLINLQCDATKESLDMNGIPTDQIVFPKRDEANVGTLIMYYELLTSLVGAMMHIHTYDQPGVELGKQILYKKFES